MLDPQYDPKAAENRWYAFWLEKNYFHGTPDENKKAYSIVIPPPNVTGSLHMGHALNNTLQDILARWKRMNGYSVCWMPGTDHAGIATQNVVERQLAAEGLTREELGREEFVKRVWGWKKESGGTIIGQLHQRAIEDQDGLGQPADVAQVAGVFEYDLDIVGIARIKRSIRRRRGLVIVALARRGGGAQQNLAQRRRPEAFVHVRRLA